MKVNEPKKFRDIIVCPNCKREFYDQWNLICFNTFGFCLLCTNKKYNKEQIVEKTNGRY